MRQTTHPLARRLAWFVGLWVAGVVTLGVFAYALRWLIGL